MTVLANFLLAAELVGQGFLIRQMRKLYEAPVEILDDVLDIDGDRDQIGLHPQDPLAVESLILRCDCPPLGDLASS